MEQAPALQPQQQPVSNDDRISQFANQFLNDLDQNTDPDQIAQEEVPEEPEQPQEPVEEAEAPEEETPAQELAEIDYEGEKFQVPTKLREAFLRQSDYTRKTQEVAASRQHVEKMAQSVQQLHQSAQQMAPLYAQMYAMQSQAQQLEGQLTDQYAESDPIGYNMTQGKLNLLINKINQFGGHIQQAKSQYDEQLKMFRNQQLAEGMPKLKAAIPDIDKTEVKSAILNYAVEKGLPVEALEYMAYSPAAVEMVWKAAQYEKLVAKQAEAGKKVQEKVKGLPAVKPTGRAQQGAQTKQLQDEWRKGGGKLDSPAFDALLRQKLRG